ncbi:MAG: inositol monophosphatase family protein [Ardenticatenia bacterium]|nr:inositol monophosphatase family protein [Ardenticatenia bacterium]
MKNTTLSLYLTAARDIVREAAELIHHHRAAGVEVRIKPADVRELVTTADEAADTLIRTRLEELFPDHVVISEETTAPTPPPDPQTPTWIVDPLDGTSNFAHGLPAFGVSVGLWWQGRPWIGVVCEVMRGWLFWAAAGRGAWHDGRRLSTSRTAALEQAILATDWTHSPERRRRATHLFAQFVLPGHTARSFGSAALGLSYVAAGWLDAYVNLGLSPWDAAAGTLLVQEAGGTVTSAEGTPWTPAHEVVVATNGPLHTAVLEMVRTHLEEEA